MKTDSTRAKAVLVLAMLVAGFVYSGLATARMYAGLFLQAPAIGAQASIDQQFARLNTSSEEIRAAIRRASWPADADVAVSVSTGDMGSEMNVTQLQYAFGYLLYPMRIRVECATLPTRHAIVIGAPDDAAHTIVARVSDVMTLVERK